MSLGRVLHGGLLPLVLLLAPGVDRCRISTESGTGELHISGTVHFLEIGSGCWRLETESGQRYQLSPEQAPASLLQDGARISIVGEPAETSGADCQVGMPIDVRRVVSVELS